MILFNHVFEDPVSNLAVEEAWLDHAETGGCGEMLRVWESPQPMVVIGRSSRADEVRLERCRDAGVPVLRRCSGGAAVVAGPGCLMYCVVLDCRKRPQLRAIDQAHQTVLNELAKAVRAGLPPEFTEVIAQKGLSDLAAGERKFSGNSLRCKRDHVLYHGTLLYDFPLPAVQDLLGLAPRQPDYRRQRDHAEFVVNVPVDPEAVCQALREAWEANDQTNRWPQQEFAEIVARYHDPQWRLA